jgi:hypothetical protein
MPGLPDPAAAVRFATALARASGLAELERVFTAGFGRVVGVPMYGFYALEPGQPNASGDGSRSSWPGSQSW